MVSMRAASCSLVIRGLATLNVSPATVSKTQTGDASPARVSTSRALPSSTISTARQYANAARAGSGWASRRDAKAARSGTGWSLALGAGSGNFFCRKCSTRWASRSKFQCLACSPPINLTVPTLRNETTEFIAEPTFGGQCAELNENPSDFVFYLPAFPLLHLRFESCSHFGKMRHCLIDSLLILPE